MTEGEEASAEAKSVDTTLIVRDSTFARAVADRGVVLDLGRDVEIAFLQAGPVIAAIEDHGAAEGIKLNPVMTEVCRVRLPWYSAVDLAMHTLRDGVKKGSINTEKLLDNIREFINLPPEGATEDGDDN